MTTSRDIVERFLGAYYAAKSDMARQYLADDVSFVGPSAMFNSADQFLKTAAHVAGVKATHIRKVFVDGADDVCVWYELELDHAVSSIPIAEWFHITDERISSMRMILDTGPFVARTSNDPSQAAVDPVCHMTVDQGRAAATRDHAGTTYFFCSAACATAFEQQPEKFLAAVSTGSD